MVDVVVTFFINNLTLLLIQESNLFTGVKKQVTFLQDELSFINVFLNNSKEKWNNHEVLKELVRQIRDRAHKPEDVIDTLIIHAITKKNRGRIDRLLHSFDHLTTIQNVAVKIKDINKSIRNIYENKDKYGIIEKTETSSSIAENALTATSLIRRRRYVEEEEVVGFSYHTEKLSKVLVQGSLQRDAVSIIGIGGLGKTTLAKKIYNNSRIKNHFGCRAWVNVSQEYSTKELLLGILEDLMPITAKISGMKADELKLILRTFLDDIRYLIVMDDI